MLEEQEEPVVFGPYTFAALVDKVTVSRNQTMEFVFRNGMKYEYTMVINTTNQAGSIV